VYAIIEDGGRQYKVSEGDVIDVDLRNLPEGTDTVEFDRILLLGEGAEAKIGAPHVPGAKVTGKVQGEIKAPKIVNYHFIRRKGHLTRKGHRQNYLRVQIETITG
jgi:large subunit ribosomal protein L21